MPWSNDFSIALLKVLVAMGWADGELSGPERELIRACMDAFYLNEQQRNYLEYYCKQAALRKLSRDLRAFAWAP